MSPRLLSLVLLTLGLWLIPAIPGAQEPAPETRSPAPEAVARPGDQARTPEPGPVPRKRSKGIRTLDEITIEGELDVPQVLFITARDRQRYFDHLHRAYLTNSLEIGLETLFPERVVVRIKP